MKIAILISAIYKYYYYYYYYYYYNAGWREKTRLTTVLVTNRWNRHRFSRILWKNPEIYSSHSFSHWNAPSPSPMLSHAYFEALRPLWYPNQHWGRGNGRKCFKIFDEYCSPAVRASATSKAWCNSGRASFSPPHSRRQKKALLPGCSPRVLL